MEVKALELRDSHTFIPLLCVNMQPSGDNHGERYLLARCGYPCDGKPNIMLTRLDGDGTPATNDYLYWGDRTFAVAHKFITHHWNSLENGDVVDVEHILGETSEKKKSERLTCPF